jgi:hypothetical protein
VAGLHVELVGFDVHADETTSDPQGYTELSVGIDCGQSLVLATDRLSYSPSEMHDLATYVTAYAPPKENSPERYINPSTLPPLPPTLALAAGLTDHCDGEFQVTNTSTQTIQLVGLGVELNAAPTLNTFPYRLIDACPFLFPDPAQRVVNCPPSLGAGLACTFSAGVTMTTIDVGVKGTQLGAPIHGFDPRLPGEPPCLQLTLLPYKEVTVVARFTAPAAGASALVYDVTPYLRVAGSQGTQDVLLPQLRSTLVFSSLSQSTCYEVNGDTFALPGPEATSSVYPGFTQRPFCI